MKNKGVGMANEMLKNMYSQEAIENQQPGLSDDEESVLRELLMKKKMSSASPALEEKDEDLYERGMWSDKDAEMEEQAKQREIQDSMEPMDRSEAIQVPVKGKKGK